MDNNTTLENIKQKVEEYCTEREYDQFHTPKDLAIGLSTEANEVLEHFRFMNEKQIDAMMQNGHIEKEEIADELADVLFFLARFAQMNQIDLSESFDRKMAKNAKKYPLSSKGDNRKYSRREV
jgi:NTP pyrophosphatase (non-canonical NTP hydrolase)